MSTWIVHGVAHCETCGWENGNYRNAQATGAIHARSHPGHKVVGEVGLAFEYP